MWCVRFYLLLLASLAKQTCDSITTNCVFKVPPVLQNRSSLCAHGGRAGRNQRGERERGGGKVVVLAGVPGYLLGCCACGSVCLTCVSRCRPSSSNCIRCQRIATPPRQQQRQHATMMAATATVVAAARVDILKLTLQLEQRLIKKSK